MASQNAGAMMEIKCLLMIGGRQQARGLKFKEKKGQKSIIILGAWSIWKCRNRCIFYGICPSLNAVLSILQEEMQLWSFAGAKRVSHLLTHTQAPLAS
jgi:hypothetical protein